MLLVPKLRFLLVPKLSLGNEESLMRGGWGRPKAARTYKGRFRMAAWFVFGKRLGGVDNPPVDGLQSPETRPEEERLISRADLRFGTFVFVICGRAGLGRVD